MTVTYIQHVHTAGNVGTFIRLLRMWKGGVAKGIWKDLLIYVGLYAGISITYRIGRYWNEGLPGNKESAVLAGFERFCVFMDRFDEYIPLGFILGFYVTQVVNRWWTQVMAIPWVDTLCMNLASYLPGVRMKNTRRLITRWAMLANILTLRRVSTSVVKRFPTYQHLVETGLMTEKEMKKLEQLDNTTEGLHATAWYPIQWAQGSLRKAKDDGSITSDLLFQELQQNLQDISSGNGTLLMYAWVNIPLVYTQLVTIAVHVYFFVTLFSRQYLNPSSYTISSGGEYLCVPPGTADSVNLVGYDESILDFYVPFFTILQFVFYFGWLKVAETLINPFGEDDDDIDANYIIDRNFQIGYLMVSAEDDDEEPEEDTYGDTIPPASLPHTVSSYKNKEPAPVLPTDNLHLSEQAMMLNNPEHPVFSQLQITTTSPRSSPSLDVKQNHAVIEMIKSKPHDSILNKEEGVSSLPVAKESDQTSSKTSEPDEDIENTKELTTLI
eukprot:GFUD01081296.1.p1 GENE.GFUD01081296.1~~GFUD01081296.1.p1  ORF type:complete len:496 (+),score=133.02 GFUD01081296.1:64-1551(+)